MSKLLKYLKYSKVKERLKTSNYMMDPPTNYLRHNKKSWTAAYQVIKIVKALQNCQMSQILTDLICVNQCLDAIDSDLYDKNDDYLRHNTKSWTAAYQVINT